jgi:hyaluronoglucosaminidase
MGGPTARRRTHRLAAALVATVLATAVGCSGGSDDDPSPSEGASATTGAPTSAPVTPEPLPTVTPMPRAVEQLGPDVEVPSSVGLAVADGVDERTTAAVTEVLTAAGASEVQPAGGGDGEGDSDGLTVRIGATGDPAVAEALTAAGLEVPADLPAEGYALAVSPGGDGAPPTIVLAADDGAGTFYAAQTLRQLVRPGAGTIAAAGVVDRPAMPLRGTIEGFYGSPWTHDERLDQLAFYGRYKLNTYVYAPKDDPYHRDRWREPYPADRLGELQQLIDTATANHVRFTFAVSPGVSVCYSDRGDTEALIAKLQAVYDLGVRSFSIALDDIEHTRWNCDGDAAAYGEPDSGAAARAQSDLVNTVQREFVASRDGVAPLQMVPTEYRGTDDSPYRSALRERLEPGIEVMWTGVLVVPAEITVDQTAAAGRVFGRPPLIWDNTPVNDFPATEGRLLLAPYARRQSGLSAQVSGIVANPMNQAAASKVALVGVADFTWNDEAYDPVRAHRAAAHMLTGGTADAATIDALLAFFDVEHRAPTSGSGDSQPQAPALAGQIEAFRTAWGGGDRSGAVAGLRPYAERLAGAPQLVRDGVTDAAFVSDCGPWLDATALWGQALVAALDGLDARARGDEAAAGGRFAEADRLAGEAGAIRTIEGETLPQGPVRVGDGVLDAFVADARSL